MLRIAFGRRFLPIERFDAHQPHQESNVPAANGVAVDLEAIAQHPGTHERPVGVQAVDAARQFETLRRNRLGFVVQSACLEGR